MTKKKGGEMKRTLWIASLSFFFIASATSAAQGEFFYGINTWGTRTGPIAPLHELRVEWHSPFLLWKHVASEVEQIELTVAQVRAAPEMIDQYIAERDWSRFDDVIGTLLGEGFHIFPVIGQCFTSTVPNYDGKPIIPHNPEEEITFFDNPQGFDLYPIGRENFLGHLYLHARAVVRKYNDVVDYWMVDPEMNQSALFRLFGGWKAGNGWADWDYVTSVLQTLYEAVKDEEPTDLVCFPFNVDQPASVTFFYAHSPLVSGGDVTVLDWPDAVTDWLPYMDIVGIDFFESQGNPDPDCYERIKERVEMVVARAEGKPVMVTSIGVPSGPTELGWSEASQAEYVAQAFDAAVHAGAQGFFYFEIQTSGSHSVEITDFDAEAMDYSRFVFNRAWYQTEQEFSLSFWTFILWLLQHFIETGSPNPLMDAVDYFKGHFFQVLETAEAYWGLVRGDGSHKPSFDALSARYHANMFTSELAQGLNMIHVPLQPVNEDYRVKDLLTETGSVALWHYDSDLESFIMVTPSTSGGAPANIEVEGDKGYFLVLPTARGHTFIGTGWPQQISVSAAPIDMIGLPVDPPDAYYASDLLLATEADYFLWYDTGSAQFQPYVPGVPDFELSGDLSYILVNAPEQVLDFPGAPWEN